MANLKSSKKDVRRIETRSARNRGVKSRLKSLAKKAAAPGAGEEDRRVYVSALDRAAKSGVIHENRAKRQKSKISRLVAGKSS